MFVAYHERETIKDNNTVIYRGKKEKKKINMVFDILVDVGLDQQRQFCYKRRWHLIRVV